MFILFTRFKIIIELLGYMFLILEYLVEFFHLQITSFKYFIVFINTIVI